ncbi:MAG: tetratricopeptide repeat protein [Tepidisphaeraceae bacterium]|jgi:tetratricopeptide (TPR) repeat protein
MSVYRRMSGRELPCGLGELLCIQPASLEDAEHQRLADRCTLGQITLSEMYLLASSHLALDEPSLAAQRVAGVLRKHVDDGRLRLVLAMAMEALGRHDRAAEHIGQILADAATAWDRLPPRAVLWCAAGLEHERAGAWRSAVRRYTEALRLTPAELFAHHRLVAIYLAHGQFSQAALHLRAILKQAPADKTARVCLAHLLQLAGRHEEAVWEYEQALCLEPDSWDLPAEAAWDLIQSEGEGAIAILEKLVKSQPQFPDLRMRLGNLYSQRGDDEAATVHYRRALSLHPEYLDCHIALARHELRMGRLDVAAEHFRRAIDINELNVETYVGLAMALADSGRAHQGDEIVASAGRIGRNSAVLVAQLAFLEQAAVRDQEDSRECGDLHDERIEDLLDRGLQTLARHPVWNDVRLHCGMLQLMLGRREQARSAFQQAVRIDGNSTEAWLQVGLSLADVGQTEAARAAFGRALFFDGRRGRLDYQLGLIRCGRLEFELALEKLEEAGPDAVDVNRRVWVAVDGLHLAGLTRRASHSSSTPLAA